MESGVLGEVAWVVGIGRRVGWVGWVGWVGRRTVRRTRIRGQIALVSGYHNTDNDTDNCNSSNYYTANYLERKKRRLVFPPESLKQIWKTHNPFPASWFGFHGGICSGSACRHSVACIKVFRRLCWKGRVAWRRSTELDRWIRGGLSRVGWVRSL